MVKVLLKHATYFGKKDEVVDVPKEILVGYEDLYTVVKNGKNVPEKTAIEDSEDSVDTETSSEDDEENAEEKKSVEDAPNKAVKAEKTNKK
jgi:hypothetical protein